MIISIIGKKYNRLTVIAEKNMKCECICECGNKITALKNNVKRGNTKSCGCYKKDTDRITKYKHGDCRSQEHRAWESMKQRCYNINNRMFYRYGERGIKVCKEWIDDYNQFLKDMGRKPKGDIKYSLDRIDNNGNYSPENCKWSTLSEQNKNRMPFKIGKRKVDY